MCCLHDMYIKITFPSNCLREWRMNVGNRTDSRLLAGITGFDYKVGQIGQIGQIGDFFRSDFSTSKWDNTGFSKIIFSTFRLTELSDSGPI